MAMNARDLLNFRYFRHLLRFFFLSHDFRSIGRRLLFDRRGDFHCIRLRRLALIAIRRVRVRVDETFALRIVSDRFARHVDLKERDDDEWQINRENEENSLW